MADAHAEHDQQNLPAMAAGLAAAALVTLIVLAALDHDGPVWLLQPILGAAAVAVAVRSGEPKRRNSLALGGLVVGTIMVLVFLAWVISEA